MNTATSQNWTPAHPMRLPHPPSPPARIPNPGSRFYGHIQRLWWMSLPPVCSCWVPSLTNDQAGNWHEFGSHLQPGKNRKERSYVRILEEPPGLSRAARGLESALSLRTEIQQQKTHKPLHYSAPGQLLTLGCDLGP